MHTQNELLELAAKVVEIQDKLTSAWHVDPNEACGESNAFLALVSEQHNFNFDLWHEEDKAREPGADDSTIAQVKRNIDGLNQRRNDKITHIDEHLEDTFFTATSNDEDLPWNSETIGSIIDRLSIASLKTFHMREQTERDDASAEHISECTAKLNNLLTQQTDLNTALLRVITEVSEGRQQNKLYRQFKMYNDPSLNPKIYQRAKDQSD